MWSCCFIRSVTSGSFLLAMLLGAHTVFAATLWNDPGATLIYDSGAGRDILDGALKRDDTSNDTLYFKFHVDPLSDSTTEEYFAAFELFEGDEARVGIGNAPAAWAYTAFFKVRDAQSPDTTASYVDLHSSTLGSAGAGTIPNNELPHRGAERTIVFKVQYVPGSDDLVTVWLNPDLSAGATEVLQPETLTTRFNANASFDEIRLRHGGGGEGWVFSDLAIATSFVDFVDPSSAVAHTSGSSPLLDQRRFSFQTWQREPAMPRKPITALAQTTEGYLWLGANDQLARFDGVRFTELHFPTGAVQTLFGDSHGALWIGTDTGLMRYQSGQFTPFTTNDGLPANAITSFCEDNSGRVWVGTSAGLSSWKQGTLQPVAGVEQLDGCAIKALFSTPNGAVWIGAKGKGVFHYEGGELMSLADSQMDSLLRDPRCLLVDREKRVWIGAGDDFVLCRDSGGWHRFRIPRHTQDPHVRALVEDFEGTVWAGSASEGLFEFNQGKLVALNSQAGLLDNQAAALLRDREGNLWVGGGVGLHLLKRKPCFRLGQAEGLGHGAVAGVAEVAPGVVWASQPGRGLFRWDGRGFRHLTAAGLDPEDPALGTMLVTADGGCWVACSKGLLLYRDPQAVADEHLLFELPHVSPSTLAEGGDGSVWAGTREGEVWQLHRGTWSQHLQLQPPTAITALAPAAGGSVWVATEDAGLYRLGGSRPVRFDTGDGLSSDRLRALYLDAEGVLWIGTDGAGLMRYADRSFQIYSHKDGLPDDRILGILEDRAGRLWLNDKSGLTCIARPERTIEVLGVYPLTAGQSEEASSVAGGAPIFPSGCRARSGQLWFATLDGVLVAEPPEFVQQTAAPALILEAVLVDGQPARGFEPVLASDDNGAPGNLEPTALHIGPGRHRLELQYTSPRFEAPDKLRFRYRMEGLDEDWVDAGAGRTALYSYLPPGAYRFHVAVQGPNGRLNQTMVDLLVSPYFWQRWWVIAVTVVGLLVVMVGGTRIVEKRKLSHRLKRLEQEHTLERERARIAQDLHDEMGAKLCRISFLSEHAARLDPSSGEIKQQIAAIAGDSRELLHSLDEIVWAVNPHNDTLEHVASYLGQYAQDYLHGTGITCELDIAHTLPHVPLSSQTRHHLFLAVHEALTNTLKHSGASLARIVIKCERQILSIQVTDNGDGFTLAATRKKAARAEATGNGLPNMQQRMQAVGGQCRMESKQGGGTTLQFTVPLKTTK